MYLYGAASARQADELMAGTYATPTLLLMEAAGRGAVQEILALYPLDSRFLVVCGTGGNGGDGYVVARELHRLGKKVFVLQTASQAPTHPDAAVNFAICQAQKVPTYTWGEEGTIPFLNAFLQEEVIVVDGLLGTGTQGPVTGVALDILEFIRPMARRVVALDLPSGLNADGGSVATTPWVARHTLSFGLLKACHYLTPASTFCGQVHLLDIGYIHEVIQALTPLAEVMNTEWLRKVYRPRRADTHKGTYGHVLIVGGSYGMAGAPALAASAALEAGAGLVSALIPGSAVSGFHRKQLEAMAVPYGRTDHASLDAEALPLFQQAVEGKHAIVLGPGMGQAEETAVFFDQALAHLKRLGQEAPVLILDADGINLLADIPARWDLLPPRTILTPHPGEMARLLGVSVPEVQNSRLKAATQLAEARGVTLVLKGHNSIVATRGGIPLICTRGNAGMATAGMGDVLAGAIGAWAAQAYSAHHATAIATCIHSVAGDRVARQVGMEAVTAEKVLRELGPAWVASAPNYPQ